MESDDPDKQNLQQQMLNKYQQSWRKKHYIYNLTNFPNKKVEGGNNWDKGPTAQQHLILSITKYTNNLLYATGAFRKDKMKPKN